MNLKTRVARLLTAVVTLFVVAQGLLAYVSLEEQEDDLVDELVIAEAHRLTARLDQRTTHSSNAEIAHLLPAHNPLSAWLIDRSGFAIPSAVPKYLVGLSDGLHRDTRPDHYLHFAVMSTPHGRLFVQYDAQQNEAKVHAYGLYLIGLALACIALGAALSARVARWAVGPIERLTERLSAWAPQETASAQTRNATVDQEHQLLEAFKRVQDRFEHGLAHERAFINNISHEIRTPLAALRTDLELCTQTLNANAPEQARLTRALKAVDHMVGSLDLARTITDRAPVSMHPIVVHTCVEDAWASVQPPDGAPVPKLYNQIASNVQVIGDRHALLTILRNLMRNAIEHASASRCVVRFQDDMINVLDDGTGIAPEHMPNLFERYWRGQLHDSATPGSATSTDARGIGLAIARQMADLNGWHISVQPSGEMDSNCTQGSCFTLRGLVQASETSHS